MALGCLKARACVHFHVHEVLTGYAVPHGRPVVTTRPARTHVVPGRWTVCAYDHTVAIYGGTVTMVFADVLQAQKRDDVVPGVEGSTGIHAGEHPVIACGTVDLLGAAYHAIHDVIRRRTHSKGLFTSEGEVNIAFFLNVHLDGVVAGLRVWQVHPVVGVLPTRAYVIP